MIGADHNGVEDGFLEDEANKEVFAWKNRFQDYLGKYYDYDLFSVIHAILLKSDTFHEKDLMGQFDRAKLKEELGNLVRHNFFSYNPVTENINRRALWLLWVWRHSAGNCFRLVFVL